MEKSASELAADEVICLREQRLRKAGLSRSYYMEKLKELCEAQKTVSCVGGKDAGSGTVDFVDVPDNAVQLGAVKVVAALYGDLAPKDDGSKGPANIVVNITRGGTPKDKGQPEKVVYKPTSKAKKGKR